MPVNVKRDAAACTVERQQASLIASLHLTSSAMFVSPDQQQAEDSTAPGTLSNTSSQVAHYATKNDSSPHTSSQAADPRLGPWLRSCRPRWALICGSGPVRRPKPSRRCSLAHLETPRSGCLAGCAAAGAAAALGRSRCGGAGTSGMGAAALRW